MKMHIAQATAETNPGPTSNPTYLIFTAIIAGVVAITVAYITNRRADSREIEKTRREVLTTAVAVMIEKSHQRYDSISEHLFLNDPTDVSTRQQRKWTQIETEIQAELVKVQIHASGPLYDAAQQLHIIHLDSDMAVFSWMNNEDKYPNYRINHEAITLAVENLIKAVRKEAKLNKKKLGSNLKIPYARTKRSPDEDATNRP